MSKKLKAIESTIQPNHKEAEIWVSPTNSDDTKEVKYWNDVKDEWSEGSSGGDEGDRIMVYSFQTSVSDKIYIAVYGYESGEYYWWFGESDSGRALTHDEYKQAIINAAK